jgi:hypothetical protein
MHTNPDSCFSPVIADLLANGASVAPDRPWSVVSGGQRFDGETLDIDDSSARTAVLDGLAAMEDEACFVIWTPIEKRQRGRIPKALRCGYTLAANGAGVVTIFQSVVFVPLDVVDILAHLPSGQVVLVKSQKVSAWDGTSADDGWPARATS